MRTPKHLRVRFSSRPSASLAACAAAALCFSSAAFGDAADSKRLALSNATLGLRSLDADGAAERLRQVAADPLRRRVIVALRPGPLAEARAALLAAGVHLLDPLGGGAFLAAIADDGLLDNMDAASRLLADVREIEPQWKVHRALSGGAAPEWALVRTQKGAPLLGLNILFHRDANPDERRAAIERHEGVVLQELRSINALFVLIPPDAVAALSAEDAALWIEPMLPVFGAFNAENRAATQVNEAQAVYGLDGAGVRVLLYDVGPAMTTHLDLAGRVTVHDFDPDYILDPHATHVAGTIGGDGTASGGLHRGMAPAALIESFRTDFVFTCDPCGPEDIAEAYTTNLGDLEATYEHAITMVDVDIATNSHGLNIRRSEPIPIPDHFLGDYTLYSAAVDAIAAGAFGRSIPIVWAAGNERIGPNDLAPYATIPPPVPAKNSIAVGAINAEDDSIAWFTAWGPTDDGRLRPDIVAPGCQEVGDMGVTSTMGTHDGNDEYISFCGTSMAAPTVAGASALLLQDYAAQRSAGERMRSSTLRALLVHSAHDIQNTGPDYQSGFGALRITDAIDLMRSGSFTVVEVQDSGAVSFDLDVPAGAPELRATLVWDDPPGTPFTVPSLVNDLDLRVFDPDGELHFPWTLDPSQPDQPAERDQPDRLNTIEQVYVQSPAPGLWRIEIAGWSVPDGPQTFSLAVTPALPFTATCPADLDGDGAVGGADLALLLGAWGTPGADIDGDGATNSADLSLLLGAWGACA